MMLRFAQPQALWGFLLVAGLLGLFIHNRLRYSKSTYRRRSLLLILAFSLCVLGLARPQLGRYATENRRLNGQLFIALDVSRSMLAQDIPPSRLEFSTAFAQRLLERVPGLKVALFPFALSGYLQVPLTADIMAISDVMASLNPSYVTNQGTDFNSPLEELFRTIVQMESRAQANGKEWFPTQVLLLSDGEVHTQFDPAVLKLFKQKRIPIFTVGVGTTAGSTIPAEFRVDGRLQMSNRRSSSSNSSIRTALNRESLQLVASQTDGDYFAPRFDEVEKLATRLVQSFKMGTLSTEFKTDSEFFWICFLLALLLFVLEFSFGRWEYAIRVLVAGALLAAAPAWAEPPTEPENTELDPEVRATMLYNKGTQELKKSNLRDAAELFQEAATLTTRPDTKKRALYNLGNAFIKLYDPSQALDAYQQAMDTKAKDSAFEKDANKRISDNIVLATRIEEAMKQQSGDSDKENQQNDQQDGKGDAPQDKKGPEQFKDQSLSKEQKQRIYDLISDEEQQIRNRLAEQKNRGKGQQVTDKPW